MLKVSLANNVTEKRKVPEFINSLFIKNPQEKTISIKYNGFNLTIRAISGLGEDFIKFYCGYINPINDKEKKEKILRSQEVEELVHYGWSIHSEDLGLGFDCSHGNDSVLQKDYLKEGFPYYFEQQHPEETFKSASWVFWQLERIADKVNQLI